MTNPLGIASKVPLANDIVTAISPYIAQRILDRKNSRVKIDNKVDSDNFVAILAQLAVCRKVSESLGSDETTCVILATKLLQVTVNFIVNIFVCCCILCEIFRQTLENFNAM